MKGVVDVLVSHHLWVYILVVIVDQGDDCAFLDEGIAVMYTRLNRNVISIRCKFNKTYAGLHVLEYCAKAINGVQVFPQNYTVNETKFD